MTESPGRSAPESLSTSGPRRSSIGVRLSVAIRAATAARAQLSLLLLLYVVAIVLTLTLTPFRFAPPRHVRLLITAGAFDAIANVLLFVPIGFLFPLTRPGADSTPIVFTTAVGALISAGIESTQLFEPARYTSALDVVTNGAGAAVGAIALRLISRRIQMNASLVGRLSLETPLVGLVYVLVPSLLIAGFAAREEPVRFLALVPLSLAGAALLAAVQRNHFGPAGLQTPRFMGLVAVGLAALGAFPFLLRFPSLGVVFILVVGVATWSAAARPLRPDHDPRFEVRALRNAAPLVVAYLVVLMVLPLLHFPASSILTARSGVASPIEPAQLRVLEPLTGLTVVGYMLAEVRGRRELLLREVSPRILLECAPIAVLFVITLGRSMAASERAIQLAMMLAAGLLGAAIYHSQLAHVRWVLRKG